MKNEDRRTIGRPMGSVLSTARKASAVLGAMLWATLALALVAPSGSAAGASGTGIEALTSIPSDSFWLADAQGAVWDFGNAPSYGSAAGLPLNHPVVAITPT
ncbi:MAG TPA: hypothetical protein VID75_01450, partial [Acidimicrobiales bacterium]